MVTATASTKTTPRAKATTNLVTGSVINVEYGSITPDPNQPRRTFDDKALRQLAGSLESEGLLQPISIRPDTDNSTTRNKRYIIIAGERRWRAAGIAGWTTIPATIHKNITEHEAAKLQLLENIVRQDLNPIEEAAAIGRMLQSGYTVAELGQCIGTPPNIVSYKLNLLNLREDIQSLVSMGEISSGCAHSLTKLSHDGQGRVLRSMASKDLSVSQVRALCDKVYVDENEAAPSPFLDLLTQEEKATVDAYAATFTKAAGIVANLGNMDQAKIDSLAATLATNVEVWTPQLRRCIGGLNKLLRSMEKQTAGDVEE